MINIYACVSLPQIRDDYLNDLCKLAIPNNLENSLEDPKKLELYYVNRDTLFSYHKVSEAFLKKIMSLLFLDTQI